MVRRVSDVRNHVAAGCPRRLLIPSQEYLFCYPWHRIRNDRFCPWAFLTLHHTNVFTWSLFKTCFDTFWARGEGRERGKLLGTISKPPGRPEDCWDIHNPVAQRACGGDFARHSASSVVPLPQRSNEVVAYVLPGPNLRSQIPGSPDPKNQVTDPCLKLCAEVPQN